jgi:hypothetical protein
MPQVRAKIYKKYGIEPIYLDHAAAKGAAEYANYSLPTRYYPRYVDTDTLREYFRPPTSGGETLD